MLRCFIVLSESCQWCSCVVCEVHEINKLTHKDTHVEKTHKEGWAVGLSPPLTVLQSIDPVWLLSAGNVSSTAALPVRGRVKAVEGAKEVRINGKSGAAAKRGGEEGKEKRMCQGETGRKLRSAGGVFVAMHAA